jgi:methionyl-tRNA synthetase
VAALFQRLDFKTLELEIEKIMEAQKASVAAPAPKAQAEAKEEPQKKAEITFEDFEKVELRVGEIIACEAVPKSNKLLKETVKFGDEVRTIVSGIAKHYKPEEMVGKKVVFVTNLAPRKICGITSEGMILAAEDENGTLSLVVADKADLLSGANCG